ncbi:2'-5' RNA ligase family protein [Clostridium hydrogenum]|uniref:2'-5' RNA ligase family protein n=1 Tax=Clostridium hydrogenum TaxID=2855764 RepID=UPI001F375FAF|nr:2'-5' RNA ligase family protein [Clostridium hydrogenum]
MRYVLACNINGEAAKLNAKLASELKYKFNAGRSKLGAHFTIKAPFETDEKNILSLKSTLEKFKDNFKSYDMEVKGYSNFREDVIYMPVTLSKEAKEVHDKLIDELKKLDWLEWKRNEGKEKVFHCTIVSKRVKENFKEMMDYVNKYKCNFKCSFDNITLYRWDKNTWVLEENYKLI